MRLFVIQFASGCWDFRTHLCGEISVLRIRSDQSGESFEMWMRNRASRRQVFIGGALAAAMTPGSLSVGLPRPRKPFSVGVNCFDLFLDHFWKPAAFDPAARLQKLAQANIPFVRFPASGHYAGHWRTFEAAPDAYWAAMDAVFHAAEKVGVRLVPSVLWNPVSLAYRNSEPLSAWGDPASRTRFAAARYTDTFVRRYRRSPAVMMWEHSNEFNIWADWRESPRFWPKRDPTVPGRAPSYADRVSSRAILSSYTGFVGDVAKLDGHPIITGGDLPRPDAWHLAHGSSGTDDSGQFRENLRAMTPTACSAISIHLYQRRIHGHGPYASIARLLSEVVAAAAESREVFVGEFGVQSIGNALAERQYFASMLEQLRISGVGYAAVWVYDRTNPDPGWSIAAENHREYQLKMIGEVNRHPGASVLSRLPRG